MPRETPASRRALHAEALRVAREQRITYVAALLVIERRKDLVR